MTPDFDDQTDRIMKRRVNTRTVHRRIAIGILCAGILFTARFSTAAVNTEGIQGADTWFMVISDVHISNDTGKLVRLADLVSQINNGKYQMTDFLVITGDCVSSFLESREQKLTDPLNNRVLKLTNVLEPLEKPYYLVMGNHEYKIDRQKDSDSPFSGTEIDSIESLWKRYTSFEPYYSFHNNGMKFLVLNSMRGRPYELHFDEEQVEWLRGELSRGEPVFLFFHHPVRTDHLRIWALKRDLVTVESEPAFMNLIKQHRMQIRGIFVGHGHLWVNDILYEKIPVYETASFGDDPTVIGYMVGVDSSEKIITEVRKLIQN